MARALQFFAQREANKYFPRTVQLLSRAEQYTKKKSKEKIGMQKSSVLTGIFKNCSPEVKKTAFDFHSVEQLLPAAAAASSRSAI